MIKFNTLQVRDQVAFMFQAGDQKLCFVDHNSILSILDLKTQQIENQYDMQECFLRLQKRFLMNAFYLKDDQIIYPDFTINIHTKSVNSIKDGYEILGVRNKQMIGKKVKENQLEHNWLGKSTNVQFVEINLPDYQIKNTYDLKLQPQRTEIILDHYIFVVFPRTNNAKIFMKKNKKFSYFSNMFYLQNQIFDGYDQTQFIIQRIHSSYLYHVVKQTYQMKQIRRIKIQKLSKIESNGKICIIISFYDETHETQSVYALDLIKLQTQLIVSDQLKKQDLMLSGDRKFACFCTKKKIYTIQLSK